MKLPKSAPVLKTEEIVTASQAMQRGLEAVRHRTNSKLFPVGVERVRVADELAHIGAQQWQLVKLSRSTGRVRLPLKDVRGRPFSYSTTSPT